MRNKKKILLMFICSLVGIMCMGAVGYYFFYYRPNKTKLIEISKGFVEVRPRMDVIPEEIREEEFNSVKVQDHLNEVRNVLSKYYSKNEKYLDDEMGRLSKFCEEQYLEGDDMVTDEVSEMCEVKRINLSLKDATVQVSTKLRETTEKYGTNSYDIMYVIVYVKEDGEWKIVSSTSSPDIF